MSCNKEGVSILLLVCDPIAAVALTITYYTEPYLSSVVAHQIK